MDLGIFFYYGLGITFIVFIFQLFKKLFKNIKENELKRIFLFIIIVAVLIIFGVATYWSSVLYKSWQGNEISRLLLPPYHSINYFLFYSFTRFFAPYLASFIVGLILFFAMKYFNKKHNGKFFEIDEPYIALLSIFLTGHPSWVFYFFSFLLIGAAANCINFLFNGRNSRLSFYYLWLPTAIFTILISKWLMLNLGWIGQIKI